MPDLPDTQTLDRLAQNPGWLIPIALFFTAWLIISNWDKLAGSFGKKRRWEAEKARLEVNQKYWELQTYKKQNKFDDKDDPFPTGAIILGNGKGEVKQVEDFSFGRRVLFGSLGGYIGFAFLFILSLSSRSQSTPSSFDGMVGSYGDFESLGWSYHGCSKAEPRSTTETYCNRCGTYPHGNVVWWTIDFVNHNKQISDIAVTAHAAVARLELPGSCINCC